MEVREILHFHMACGLGGGAAGFNAGEARVGNMEAKFVCLGGVDVDPAAIRDFERMTGVRGTGLDLFTREQYIAFHGKEPPDGWREATPADLRRAAQNKRPHVVVTSMPCKGFSGLLSQALSLTGKYQALNHLTLRSMWLVMEAWSDDPPELIVFENVPRIATRGRYLLDQIVGLMQSYGYAVAETQHDCGEIGGLAQSRKRFLMVARHIAKVPPFLYQPDKHQLRAVGEVLGRMPMPGDLRVGPMHRLPALQWKTWVRLAFVEAGGDWRSLKKLKVKDGVLADYLLVPQMHHGVLGVTDWREHASTVTGNGRPATGKFSVADPRIDAHPRSVQHGVRRWDEPAPVVTGKMFVGGGPHAIADPRMADGAVRHNNVYRVVRWSDVAPTVTAGGHPSAGGTAVADPRPLKPAEELHGKFHITPYDGPCRAIIGGRENGGCYVADPRPNSTKFSGHGVTKWEEPARTVAGESFPSNGQFAVADPRPDYGPSTHHHALKVTPWDQPGGTITASRSPGSGALCVADPRPACVKREGDEYESGGHYGVVPWDRPANVVAGTARHDNGFNNVADPRVPAGDERLVALIVAADGTWHRPFTTFELAGLQSLVEPEDWLELDGLSDSAWRERIGNAIPKKAAKAIADVCGRTLLLAWSGETFFLSGVPIWVRQVAVALSVRPA